MKEANRRRYINFTLSSTSEAWFDQSNLLSTESLTVTDFREYFREGGITVSLPVRVDSSRAIATALAHRSSFAALCRPVKHLRAVTDEDLRRRWCLNSQMVGRVHQWSLASAGLFYVAHRIQSYSLRRLWCISHQWMRFCNFKAPLLP